MKTTLQVPFFRLSDTGNALGYIDDVLNSGWLTTGRCVAEFERHFAERSNCDFALAVNSCTAALHLALDSLGIGEGDQVIVPSLTFTATAEVIRYLGAHPLLVDIDANTGLLSGQQITDALETNDNVKACMVVHFAGQSAALTGESGIQTICEQHGIPLIQDAAHAFPAADDYGPVGSIGEATCFSFYANKTITTGEGGMIVTNNKQVADRAKLMRLHGIDRDVWNRFTSTSASWEYDVIAAGYKYNMPDINAAIGLAQLETADEFRDKRQAIALRYLAKLGDVASITLLRSRVKNEQHAWHLFPIVLNDTASVSRDEMIEKLQSDGIGTSVHYKPLHRLTYYKEKYQLQPESFPNTEAYWRGCLSLPLFPSMTIEQVDYVIDRICYHLEDPG